MKGLARWWVGASLTAAAWAGCSGGGDAGSAASVTPLTAAQLRDPTSCAGCHPTQAAQWSASAHAFASDDPVFVAMNARAQREDGVGDYCVKCHAPVALATGATKDGTNLASLPAALHGVTCYFCHTAGAVAGTHNAPVSLAGDGVMRASISDPIAGAPHGAAYSPLHDRDRLASASLCGSCHDIVSPAGAAVARTYAEWQSSFYAHDVDGQRLTCGNCHMTGTSGPAANFAGAPTRPLHDHTMPAVDARPGDAKGTAAVRASLDPAIVTTLCVTPYHGQPNVVVWLDDASAGHALPSGASYDRRLWVEFEAYRGADLVASSGKVPADKAATSVSDPDLWLLRTRMFDAAGGETLFQWKAAKTEPALLSPSVTNVPTDPAYYHALNHSYTAPLGTDRVTVRAHLRPVDFDLIDALIAGNDLDPGYRSKVVTYDLASTELTWTSADGDACLPPGSQSALPPSGGP